MHLGRTGPGAYTRDTSSTVWLLVPDMRSLPPAHQPSPPAHQPSKPAASGARQACAAPALTSLPVAAGWDKSHAEARSARGGEQQKRPEKEGTPRTSEPPPGLCPALVAARAGQERRRTLLRAAPGRLQTLGPRSDWSCRGMARQCGDRARECPAPRSCVPMTCRSPESCCQAVDLSVASRSPDWAARRAGVCAPPGAGGAPLAQGLSSRLHHRCTPARRQPCGHELGGAQAMARGDGLGYRQALSALGAPLGHRSIHHMASAALRAASVVCVRMRMHCW